MIRVKYFATITVLNLVLSSCSGLNEKNINNSPHKMYAIAQQKLRDASWKQAIRQLEALNDYYPFCPYSKRVQLDLIYAYYKNVDLLLAQATIDRFIRLNPTDSKIDYVIYMSGLINMALDDSATQIFFGIDRSDRDPQHAHDAFNDFSKLLRSYPNSQYVTEATKHIVFLKNRLAKYEYSVASYYTRRGAWIAVVNRVKGMLHDYPCTKATRNGLKLMEKAYRQMQMNAQADKVAKIISANNRNI